MLPQNHNNLTIPWSFSATNLVFAPKILLSAVSRIWHSCLHSLKHSVPRIWHSRLNSFLPQCHESGIRACILLSAVSRIWHSRLHSLRHSVHESCIRARNSILRSAHESGIRACVPSSITPSMSYPQRPHPGCDIFLVTAGGIYVYC